MLVAAWLLLGRVALGCIHMVHAVSVIAVSGRGGPITEGEVP